MRTLRNLLRGPVTAYRALAYALLAALAGSVFLLIVTAHDSLLVTVPASGGTLTEGIIGAPNMINPVLATTDTDVALSRLVFAGLLKERPDGTVIPEIAKEYSVSPDGRTYTLTLRPATFHDGKPLTSADMAFTVAKLQSPGLNPAQASYWGGVSLTTPDPQTVILVLPEPRADFLARLTVGIVPEHRLAADSDEAFVAKAQHDRPVGAGAFKVSRRKHAAGVIDEVVLKRNPRYVLGAPLLKKLVVRVFNNQKELLQAVEKGDVMMTAQLLPATLADATLPKRTLVTAVPSATQAVLYRLKNDRSGILGNAATSAALSEIIDKQKIIAIVENGYGEAPVTGAPSAETSEQARKKLETLGYRLNNGILTQGGKPVGISIATTNDPDMVALATALAGELRALGIIVSIRNFDQGFFHTELSRQTFNTVLLKGTVSPGAAYEPVIPLYRTTIPFVAKTTARGIIPSGRISPVLRYATVNEWYVITDKLYPLFARKTAQPTIN